jgi:hypothetical protein
MNENIWSIQKTCQQFVWKFLVLYYNDVLEKWVYLKIKNWFDSLIASKHTNLGENWFPIHLCIICPFELYIEIITHKCKFVEIIEVWIYHTFQKIVYIIYSTTIGVLCFEDQASFKNWNNLWMFVHLVFWSMESGRLLF